MPSGIIVSSPTSFKLVSRKTGADRVLTEITGKAGKAVAIKADVFD